MSEKLNITIVLLLDHNVDDHYNPTFDVSSKQLNETIQFFLEQGYDVAIKQELVAD